MELVDAYVTRLGRALRGPRRARADLLTEVRDSLVDAAEAYGRAGYDADAAARRAVEDFGEVREIAAGYQVELGMIQARRTAVGILLAIGGQPLFWNYLRPHLGTTTASDSPGPLHTVIDVLMEWCGTATLLAAAALLLAIRLAGHSTRVTRAAGLLANGAGVLFALLGATMTLIGPGAADNVLWLAVVLLVPMLVLIRSGHRCLRSG
ncbi:hypothetical protein Val02_58820 [Virgisporangium aliadipatigenens]|uniref:Uncharacterized protein n=1 Tax=Virgisporangium aliadipatigenens TaxID=741659 RepID=A0A8J3YSG4_9ACTN|nr:permease prefix domain 1-containing protein [Virgisporangium aliadipatigenens]GIJ48996.1 hypothetical protein Val02_58820 [Virgisporangium aliadipatigenens]